MHDQEITALLWQRDERALAEAERLYGAYCRTVAMNLLGDAEDAAECVNDAWLRLWTSVPPGRPERLRPYLAKLTRNLALDRCRARGAEKRGRGEVPALLAELEECLPSGTDAEDALLGRELEAAVQSAVRSLPPREGDIFTRRYFFAESIAHIAKSRGMTENHVAVVLSRARKKLKEHLEKEGLLP